MKLGKDAAWLAAVGCCLLGATARAEGASPTVVVLRAPLTDAVTSEAAARVEGELAAAGFRVTVVSTTKADTAGELDSVGRELSPVAAFAILARPGTGAEIWVTDRLKHKTVIERAQLAGDRDRAAEILAVRAVELLKASLAELWLPAKQQAPSPAPPPPSPAQVHGSREEAEPAAPRAAFGSGLGIGIGAGMIEGFGSLGATWAPTAQITYGADGGFGVRASFAGLGPSSTLTAAAGSARIDQQVAAIEVVQAFWPRGAVVPFVCGGAGAEHIHVEGKGTSPYYGMSSDDWSVVTSAGAGIGVPIYGDWSFTAQGRAVLGWPPTTVRIASSTVARLDDPTLVFDAGILGVFR